MLQSLLSRLPAVIPAQLRLLGCVLLALAGTAVAEQPVVVSHDGFDQRLTTQLQWLPRATGIDTLDQARAARAAGEFSPVPMENLQLGYQDEALWLHFRLQNQLLHHTAANRDDRFYLSVDYPLLDNVEFYLVQGDRVRTMVTGDLYHFTQRYFNLNNFVFPIALAPGASGDIYIRVFSSSSLVLPVRLQTERAFVDNQFALNTLNGLYLGITLGLGIYNLFLWVGVRKAVYGVYVLLVTNICLFNSTIMGFTYRLWPDFNSLQQYSIYIFSFSSGVLVILFGVKYLNTRTTQPRLHRLLMLQMWVYLACIPALFAVPVAVAAKLTVVTTIFGSLTMILVAIRSVLAGYHPAIYYLLGQGAVLLSVLFVALASQNVIPNYYLAPQVMKWCSAFELIVFSLGLAEMMNTERRLREQAQAESQQSQKQLLQTQLQLNEELDQLVRQRTRELEAVNQQLRDLNIRDDLTGLHNRRYLNETLSRECQQAYRQREPLSLLMLDIDFFKQLNDTYGH
ncbi:MAG: hypothetical protein CML06_01925 [Pseudomonadales bacterium]|nr:hypothetical protein [Pseudomonadales bacterium]